MSRALMTIALLLTLAASADAVEVEVPLDPEHWRPTPGWTPQTAAEEHSHTLDDGIATFRASGGGATMIWLQSLDLGDLSDVRWVSLRYRVEAINPTLPSYFLWGDAGEESTMSSSNLLLSAEDLIVDGDWHVLTRPVQLPGLARLGIRFQAVEGELLEIPHVEGATYRDLWNGRDLTPQIRDGHAVIEQTLGARNIGVIARIRP